RTLLRSLQVARNRALSGYLRVLVAMCSMLQPTQDREFVRLVCRPSTGRDLDWLCRAEVATMPSRQHLFRLRAARYLPNNASIPIAHYAHRSVLRQALSSGFHLVSPIVCESLPPLSVAPRAYAETCQDSTSRYKGDRRVRGE